MNANLTELIFILDKSGSMAGLERDTVGGFNSMLAKQQAEPGECRITTALFDNNYHLLHDRIDMKAINPMTLKEYSVGGSTALLDAIGTTIHKIVSVQKSTAVDFCAQKLLFIIITDGEENSSREYTAEKIKALINEQQEKQGWEFIFLGANIDAVQTAGRFGIAPAKAVDYLADSKGTALNFQAVSAAAATFRREGKVDTACFTPIRAHVKQRGNPIQRF